MRAAKLLLSAGVGAAAPLAAVEVQEADGTPASVYVSEALIHAEPLRAAFQRCGARDRRRMGRAIGRFVACLHASGIYVPDLKDENLLVELDTEREPRLFLVDLDRVNRYGSRYCTMFGIGTFGSFSIRPCHHPPTESDTKYMVMPTASHQKWARISPGLNHSRPVSRGTM